MHADQRIRDVTLAVDFVAFLIRPPLLSHPSFLPSVSVACMHGEVVGIYRSSENVIDAMRNECNGFLTGWAMVSLERRPVGSSLSWARDWYLVGAAVRVVTQRHNLLQISNIRLGIDWMG